MAESPSRILPPGVDGPGAAEAYPVEPDCLSRIRQPLAGEDCMATLRAVSMMGASIRVEEDGSFVVESGEWSSPPKPLDCGNSGTTMRLLAGVIASRPGLVASLVGDESLSRRPMGRVAQPLALMGADIQGERPPLRIRGSQLTGISYDSPVASAQVKSCLLLAGLKAHGETRITEPSLSRDHTERMLTALGVELTRHGDSSVSVRGGQSWTGFDFRTPGDISSAAFWLAGAAGSPGSEILLHQVGINPTRTGILDVLAQAGVLVQIEGQSEELGEPLASLRLCAPDRLEGFEIFGAMVPRLIDEIPVLAALATQCHGRTVIRDAQELKVKESDRIASVAQTLTRMGAKVEARPDGFVIEGPTPLVGTELDARGDHRIAMAFAIASGWAKGDTTISGAESIATSYPQFWSDFHALSQ
jgi:3-phosphoshikimate 1-carboxyvinyltransferase